MVVRFNGSESPIRKALLNILPKVAYMMESPSPPFRWERSRQDVYPECQRAVMKFKLYCLLFLYHLPPPPANSNQVSLASSSFFLFLVSRELAAACGAETPTGENMKRGSRGGNFGSALIAFVMFEFATRVCVIF